MMFGLVTYRIHFATLGMRQVCTQITEREAVLLDWERTIRESYSALPLPSNLIVAVVNQFLCS